jgi:iron complex transport system ATP-binding protein
MTGIFLQTDALHIGYASRPVSGPLSLSLRKGELVCLLGPNGAGKSTLMRTLSGLQAPLKGSILLEGIPLEALSPVELARKRSLVLTDRTDPGNLTAGEVIALGRTPHTNWLGRLTPVDQQQIQTAIDLTDTGFLLSRRMPELSDGERQKVMLARALAQDTDLILLDEPTAHLDLPNRVAMMQLLHRLARTTGKAILLSTHELDLALQTADRLWLITRDGTLHAGVPEDLVLDGTFETAFARDGLQFDRQTGGFRIRLTEEGPVVSLAGPDSIWLRQALAREGYRIRADGGYLLSVEESGWKTTDGQLFTTIETLLAHLRNQLFQ